VTEYKTTLNFHWGRKYMAYKNILVHLSESRASENAVEAALSLAQNHGSRVVGLFAGLPYDMPQYVSAQLPPEVVEAYRQNTQEQADKQIKAFEKRCSDADVKCDARTGDWNDLIERVICTHARYADLVIIGQPDPEMDGGYTRDAADYIVLNAGSPVLLVPTRTATHGFGGSVLVAWDGSANAARAIRDAMPMLEKAEKVKVLAVDPKPGKHGLGDLPGADIAHHLALHGVVAEAEHMPSAGVDVGDVVLNEAANMGADLIVSGGYGHSRLGELILGGVTDTLMKEMTVPVLMSH
jgi:nucleotide-binding universal stress UspA family protein